MRNPKLSQAAFLLALSILTLTLIPACGGGGSGGSADATAPPVPQETFSRFVVHTKAPRTDAGLTDPTTGSLEAAVATWNFTPTSASDVISAIQVTFQVAYSHGSATPAPMRIVLKDASARIICTLTDTTIASNASLQTFRIHAPVSMQVVDTGSLPAFPSPQYHLQILARNPFPGSMDFQSASASFFVHENVVVESNSSTILF